MDKRYEILFQPIQIGPVTAPNRFYQVPHCNGMGYRMPRALAAMRAVKAEGGWGVVCTEEVEIHHSSDLAPFIEGRLWDDADIPAMAAMTEAVHAHGTLAGIELAYNGLNAANLYSRTPPLAARSMSVFGGGEYNPVQTRRMDKEDFRAVRRWHRLAALRAKQAGFDIIYCYAGHCMTLAMQLLLPRYNDRSDEYGGCLENRVRFLRELIEDTKEAVGDTCAVALRFAVDELMGQDGLTHQVEAYEIVAMLAELPDLWDVNISGWQNDSATSRFEKEGYQEPYIAFVKRLTSKPVVGVGRYTTPDAMVAAIRHGIVDLIGAARPSIADPYLPNKIKTGQLDDIRECIGCNICITGDTLKVPIRCTQNPTMGEEWRRGWHPEKIPPKKSDRRVMVIGAGPAGLECARALGQRGYPVALLDARRELGGRINLEATLPGLQEWRRVVDWRRAQLEKLAHVEFFPSSLMTASDVLDTGYKDVVIATGATWRRDGIGRQRWKSLPGCELPNVFTPDDIYAGKLPGGHVVIFDDDHYYLGGVLAEFLVANGCQVALVTPASLVSHWASFTLEQERIQERLMKLDVRLYTQYSLDAIQSGAVEIRQTVSGESQIVETDHVLLLTDRLPNDDLYRELKPALADKTLNSLRVIGDAEAPGIIAQAVFSGHLAARQFDTAGMVDTPFRMERVSVD